jgi:hypothetical protein
MCTIRMTPTSVLVTASLAVGVVLTTPPDAVAGGVDNKWTSFSRALPLAVAKGGQGTTSTGNQRPMAASPTAGNATNFGSRATVVLPNVVYDARLSSPTFGRRITLPGGAQTVTTDKPIIRDHRKGSDFGKEGSNCYPPAGTHGTDLPTSGNIVRDHRSELPPGAITRTTVTDHRAGANPNPYTTSSFRTGTGETVTVKSRQKPQCIGNMCWLTD